MNLITLNKVDNSFCVKITDKDYYTLVIEDNNEQNKNTILNTKIYTKDKEEIIIKNRLTGSNRELIPNENRLLIRVYRDKYITDNETLTILDYSNSIKKIYLIS